jgi:hypothetical protein
MSCHRSTHTCPGPRISLGIIDSPGGDAVSVNALFDVPKLISVSDTRPGQLITMITTLRLQLIPEIWPCSGSSRQILFVTQFVRLQIAIAIEVTPQANGK